MLHAFRLCNPRKLYLFCSCDFLASTPTDYPTSSSSAPSISPTVSPSKFPTTTFVKKIIT